MKKQSNQTEPTIAMHRGASTRFPENSVAAIKEAINIAAEHPDLNFFIEIDVRETEDGHLVLMHDSTIGRTTRGEGAIEHKTLEEIAALKMHSLDDIVPETKQSQERSMAPLFPVTNHDLRIPTLDETLALVSEVNSKQPGRNTPIGLAIEIKPTGKTKDFTRYTIKSVLSGVAELLGSIGLGASADVIRPPNSISQQLAQHLNRVPYPLPPMVVFSAHGMAGKRDLETSWELFNDSVKQQLSPNGKGATAPTILIDENTKGAKRFGLEAIQHTKRFWDIGWPNNGSTIATAQPRDTKESVIDALEHGANFITTNYPEHAIAALKERQASQPERSATSEFSFLQQEEARRNGKNNCKASGMNGCPSEGTNGCPSHATR